jgi:hypothetical protein
MEKSTKSTLSAVAIFVVTFAVAFFGTKMLFGNSTDKELKKISEQINKSCPINVDSETRLDSVSSFEGAKIQYHYTLVNVTREDTAFHSAEAKKFVLTQSQKSLDNNPQMADFRDKKVKMEYVYKDRNGKELFDFTITPTKK